MTTERTCNGDCCVAFVMARTPEELADPKTRAEITDGDTLHEMLIPLSRQKATARAKKFGVGTDMWKGSKHQVYMCRFWDEETRLCGIYERRPQMCRDYPYDHACTQEDCCYVPDDKTRYEWAVRHDNTQVMEELAHLANTESEG